MLVSDNNTISSANVIGEELKPFTLRISSLKPSKSLREGIALVVKPIKAPSPNIEKA